MRLAREEKSIKPTGINCHCLDERSERHAGHVGSASASSWRIGDLVLSSISSLQNAVYADVTKSKTQGKKSFKIYTSMF
jgi:hypothetical protein